MSTTYNFLKDTALAPITADLQAAVAASAAQATAARIAAELARDQAAAIQVPDNTITNAKLSGEVPMKNYPFQVAASVNATLKSAIKDIKIYNSIPAKLYTLAVLCRNVTISGVPNSWIVRIYEWTGSSFGSLVFDFNKTSYTPSATIETITVQSGSLLLSFTIDWSQVADGTNISAQPYASAGISALAYRNQADYDSYIATKVSTIGVNPVNLIDAATLLSSNETVVIQNTNTRDQTNAGISAISIALTASSSSSFNTVAFPGHNFANASSVYAFCYLKTLLGYEEVHLIAFDARTADYKFLLNRFFSLSESLTLTFGYCDGSLNTFSPGSSIGLATSSVDANLVGSVIKYISGSTSIFAATIAAGNTNWKSTAYKLLSTTRLVSSPTLASSPPNGSVTPSKLSNGVATKNFPFSPTTTPSAIFSTGIAQIWIYGADPAKQYVLAVVVRVSPSTQIRIYEWTGSSFGPLVFDFNKTSYTPSATIETITLAATGSAPASAYAQVTVNWSVIIEGTNLVNQYFYLGGISPLAYQPIPNTLTQPFDLVLPPKLYWIAGNPLWMYWNATVYNYNIFARRQADAYVSSAKVSNGASGGASISQYPDYAVVTPSESINLTAIIRDYSLENALTGATPTTVLSKTYSLSVVTKPTGKAINTIVIADSFWDLQWGAGIYSYLQAMAVADGNTIVFKGTRTSYGFLGESRAGWTESTFFRYVPTGTRIGVNGDPTNALMSSPFMFSPDDTAPNAVFDFAQYLSTNSIGAVDQVVICLGKNGGDGANINNMITSIKAAAPNAKVIISYVTPVGLIRSSIDIPIAQKNTDNQNYAYNTRFSGRESSGIYLCPASISFPRLFGHNNGTMDQVQFNLTSVPQVYLNTDHHPNATGAKAIAWSVYNYMLYASTQ